MGWLCSPHIKQVDAKLQTLVFPPRTLPHTQPHHAKRPMTKWGRVVVLCESRNWMNTRLFAGHRDILRVAKVMQHQDFQWGRPGKLVQELMLEGLQNSYNTYKASVSTVNCLLENPSTASMYW